MNYSCMISTALGILLTAAVFAVAQTPRTPPKEVPGYLVVAVCGTLPAPAYVAGNYASPTIDVTGKLCVNQ
jgi:uncharacterized membrane protein YoaK (UPF0700 family)